MYLWGIPGTYTYNQIPNLILRDNDIFIIVYDITDIDSLNVSKMWIDEIKKNFNSENFFLLGNKSDLNELKKISRIDVENFTRENNIKMFYEVSAKNDSQEDLRNILKQIIKQSNIDYKKKNNSSFKLEIIPVVKTQVGCFERLCNFFS